MVVYLFGVSWYSHIMVFQTFGFLVNVKVKVGWPGWPGWPGDQLNLLRYLPLHTVHEGSVRMLVSLQYFSVLRPHFPKHNIKQLLGTSAAKL